ncbi:MAG: CCA tRNA nucleotidyltransferase [Planctomycetota bacterium]
MPELDPEKQRQFAVEVVRRLRDAGFEAYWAGGCVRDRLLGKTPKDYDVATDATPPEIRRIFGHRRTLAIGAAFGVITVLGPRQAGQIEVATFRRDAAYSDGRHPDGVAFSTAREDASRRDFTINGIFYDPVDERVIDYVGGREDLARGVIRAIGDPRERIREDKLRMLRAVRFTAALRFALDANTLDAIHEMAAAISVVSPERIAVEMERMLVGPGRTAAVRLVVQTGLAAVVLPEVVARDEAGRHHLDHALDVLERLEHPAFPLALAVLLIPVVDPRGAEAACRRWRLSNRETERVRWLVGHHRSLEKARSTPWSAIQKILIADGIDDLLALGAAEAQAGSGDASQVEWCRSKLAQPPEVLNPPPLLTGDDLIQHGIPAGPAYRVLLERVRDAQLDRQIHSKTDALGLVDRLLAEGRAAED